MKATMEPALHTNRPNWWLPVYAAVFGWGIHFLIIMRPAFDIAEFLYLFIGVPISSLILIVIAVEIRKQRITIFAMLGAYLLATYIAFLGTMQTRNMARWFLHSKTYKAQIVAQPNSPGGELKHAEWDGWGLAGSDTEAYVVYDPGDSLTEAARKKASGKLNGIPCPVSHVQRLEKYWYAVVFYTNTSWNICN